MRTAITKWPTLSVLLGACAAAPPAPPAPTATPTQAAAPGSVTLVADPPEPADPDPYRDALNLDFEAGEPLTRWVGGAAAYELGADTTEHHAGIRSGRLRLRPDASGNFGAASIVIPADDARNRRFVLRGWLKSEGVVGGWAGLWVRVVGPRDRILAFDNMGGRGLTGTTDWTQVEIALEVPGEATTIFLGFLLVGPGTVWADDLSIRITDPAPPPSPIAITARVIDASGEPVDGAIVAITPPYTSRPIGIARTGAGGRTKLVAPPGDYALTATSPAGVASYEPVAPRNADAEVTLRLGTEGFRVTGTIAGWNNPAPIRVLAARSSEVEGDVFVTDVAPDGRFELRLPGARGYSLTIESTAALGDEARIERMEDQTITLSPIYLAPPPDEVVEWVKQNAAPLVSVEAGNGFDDLAPLGEIVKGARIVALGEATHGSREIFQMKHRALEYLVAKQGFTLFAIEANQPEARKVNDYVLEGKGDPKEALEGLYFWTWYTEEVLAQIEWMRSWNADPAHRNKVKFAGFDMQTTIVAWPAVKEYLGRVDPEYVATLPSLDALGAKALPEDPEELEVLAVAVAAIEKRLDRKKKGYVKASSALAWTTARQDARVIGQCLDMARVAGGLARFDARDEAMAENVAWLLAQEPKGTKMVIWAHNGHVMTGRGMTTPMGMHLRKKFGAAYRPVAAIFREGSFQAIAMGKGLREHSVRTPPAGDWSDAFERAGHSIALLDLRALPAGTVGDWLRGSHPMYETGAVFFDEAHMWTAQPLAGRYDALFYIEKTTRARPVE